MEIIIGEETTANKQVSTNLGSGSREIIIEEETVTCMDQFTYGAAVNGNINFFKDDDMSKGVELLLTPNKNTVLHIHFTAQKPQTASESFTKYILDVCPTLVLQRNCDDETPLHTAARYGHSDIVKILIEHAKALGKDPEIGIQGVDNFIRATNHWNNTALHEAVRFRHLQTVEILINEDRNHSYSVNNDCETPLYMAAVRGYQDVVLKILTTFEAPIAYHGPNGRTALHAAVRCNNQEMVEHMLRIECLKASIRQVDEQGWTPLHHAARYRLDSIAELLLMKDRKTAYMRDTDGRTALHVAAITGRVNVMKVILLHCPDCSELVDKDGCNALHYAIKGRRGGATSVILKRSSLSNLFNQKDSEGNTALHLIADQSLFKMSNLIKHPRVDKMALNQRKHTALDIASDKEGSSAYKTGKLLKDNGAKPGSGRQSMRKYYKMEDDKLPDWFDRSRDSNLVMVALIATVTFAAGFTLPGGSIPDGKNAGSPILKHNRAFQAFIISDTVAMVLSSSAVVIHLFLTFTMHEVERAFSYLLAICVITIYAMLAMVIAFISGIYAVLGGFSGLGVPTLLIGLLFFLTNWYFLGQGILVPLYYSFNYLNRARRKVLAFWVQSRPPSGGL